MTNNVLAIAHEAGNRLTVMNIGSWDVISGTPTLPYTGEVVDFSPDGNYLAAGNSLTSPFIRIMHTSDWSLVSGAPTLPGAVSNNGQHSLRFSRDGQYLAFACSLAPFLVVYNTSDWSTVSGPTVASHASSVAFSHDGQYLAVTTTSGLVVFRISDWSVVNGGLPAGVASSLSLEYSPDGQYLVYGTSAAPYLFVIDTSDWSLVGDIPAMSTWVKNLSFLHDGTRLAVVGSGTPNVAILDTSTWSAVSGPSPTSAVSAVYSPDGQYLAVPNSTFGDGRLRVYNTSDWSVVSGTPSLPGVGGHAAWLQLPPEYLLPTPTNLQTVAAGGNRALVSWDWTE